jgi:hypothetical protein
MESVQLVQHVQHIYVNKFDTPISHVEIQTSYKKSSVLWDIEPCSPLKVDGPFGVICRLHLHGRSISHARNQSEIR